MLSGTADAEAQATLRAEQEKQRRIEQLTKKAGARIKNQGIMKGWSAWHALYEEQVAQRQMLASAGARLMRPKLAASFSHWRTDWAEEAGALAAKGHKQLLAEQKELSAALEAELRRVKEELGDERVAAGRAAALAAEHEKTALERLRAELSGSAEEQAAAREAAAKEKRVEELSKKAGARIKNQGIMRGWSAWQELYEEMKAQRQMLGGAGARCSG